LKNLPLNSTPHCPPRSGLSRREGRFGRSGFWWAKLRLRDFKPRDVATLAKIDSLCFPAALAYNKDQLLEYLRHRSATTFIAEYDWQIIGFALVIHQKREKHIHLVTLDVLPQYQGLGIGKWLLGAVLQLAASVKVARVQLEVAVTNREALGLYRKFRFRIARKMKRYYADNTDGFFMVLDFVAQSAHLECASNKN